MSVSKATIQVLRDAGKPLHVKEITARILGQKLWRTSGKTPEATVSAQLYANIKRNGEKSPFVLVASMTFGLREGTPTIAPQQTPAASSESREELQKTTCSFTQAAKKILEQFGDKRPMHYRDIAKKAIELNWLDTAGQTPAATMGAQIYTAIKRARRRGVQSHFVQHGRGLFGLSKWMGQGLSYEIEQHNKHVRGTLRKQLLNLTPKEFEELIGALFNEMGFEDIEVIGRSGDGGIDVRATLVVGDVICTKMAIQVKRWKNNVPAPIVQQVRGSLGTHEQGLIITTSDFSSGARKEAERPDAIPVGLMDGDKLATLLMENGIGVTKEDCVLFNLSSDNLSE